MTKFLIPNPDINLCAPYKTASFTAWEEYVLCNVWLHKKVRSDEIVPFLLSVAQRLEEVGYLRYTFKSYKINMDKPLCIALINEYLKEKKKWPNPFNPGFPKNPDKDGIHIINIDGVLNIFRWLPATKEYMDCNNGLKPYYPTELYNIENCFYYCSFEELPKKWGME